MSANMDLRWLKPSMFQGTTKRFAEFCKTDIKQQAEQETDFDVETYHQATKLIINKLQDISDSRNKGNSSC